MKKIKILVVDDVPGNLRIFALEFRKLPAVFKFCEKPEDALELCIEEYFDIILVDLYMPEIDGIELTKELRKMENYCSVPIYILTSEIKDVPETRIISGVLNKMENVKKQVEGVIAKHSTPPILIFSNDSNEIQDLIGKFKEFGELSVLRDVHNKVMLESVFSEACYRLVVFGNGIQVEPSFLQDLRDLEKRVWGDNAIIPYVMISAEETSDYREIDHFLPLSYSGEDIQELVDILIWKINYTWNIILGDLIVAYFFDLFHNLLVYKVQLMDKLVRIQFFHFGEQHFGGYMQFLELSTQGIRLSVVNLMENATWTEITKNFLYQKEVIVNNSLRRISEVTNFSSLANFQTNIFQGKFNSHGIILIGNVATIGEFGILEFISLQVHPWIPVMIISSDFEQKYLPQIFPYKVKIYPYENLDEGLLLSSVPGFLESLSRLPEGSEDILDIAQLSRTSQHEKVLEYFTEDSDKCLRVPKGHFYYPFLEYYRMNSLIHLERFEDLMQDLEELSQRYSNLLYIRSLKVLFFERRALYFKEKNLQGKVEEAYASAAAELFYLMDGPFPHPEIFFERLMVIHSILGFLSDTAIEDILIEYHELFKDGNYCTLRRILTSLALNSKYSDFAMRWLRMF